MLLSNVKKKKLIFLSFKNLKIFFINEKLNSVILSCDNCFGDISWEKY